MKKSMILCILCLALFPMVYPVVLTSFPDMVKPIELRIDGGNIYISDQYSVFVYDLKTFKLVKKLGNRGEGPQEFKSSPRINFTRDRLILSNYDKIIVYSKDLKLVKEIRLHTSEVNRVIPIEENFVLMSFRVIEKSRYTVFELYNSKLEKIQFLSKDLIDESVHELLISPWPPICICWAGNIFIAQPKKGFYIEVFNKNGEKLYQIEKNVEKIKPGEKHRNLYMELLTFTKNKFYYLEDQDEDGWVLDAVDF